MKVKDFADGSLVLDGRIKDGIDEAFREDRYIEAFTLLHAEIDWLLAHLHQLKISESGPKGAFALQKLIDEYPYKFKETTKELVGLGVLTRREQESLLYFNDVRNRILHRMPVRSYQMRRWNRITRAEAIRGFKAGRDLLEVLERKTNQLASWLLRGAHSSPSMSP